MSSRPNSTISQKRLAWASSVRIRYRDLTPRQLASELLELGAELTEAEAYDPVSRQVVELLAGERLRLGRIELRRLIAGDRA